MIENDSLVDKANDYFLELDKLDLIIYDKKAQLYLDKLLDTILNSNNLIVDTFSINIVSSIAINAAVFPNQKIIITTGLLQRMNSREELAFIISHEIAHYVKEHFKIVDFNNFEEEEEFKKNHEYEADAAGLEYYLNCGFSKNGAISALEKLPLEINSEWMYGGKYSRYRKMRSHPRTPFRVRKIKKSTSHLTASDQVNDEEYALIFQKLSYDVRWNLFEDADNTFEYGTQIYYIDKLIISLGKDTVKDSKYNDFLIFLACDRINTLMSLMNIERHKELVMLFEYFDAKNNNIFSEESFSSLGNTLYYNKDVLKEYDEKIKIIFFKYLGKLAYSSTYQNEHDRILGLYNYREKEYKKSAILLDSYLKSDPKNPSWRYASSVYKRIPKKYKKNN